MATSLRLILARNGELHPSGIAALCCPKNPHTELASESSLTLRSRATTASSARAFEHRLRVAVVYVIFSVDLIGIRLRASHSLIECSYIQVAERAHALPSIWLGIHDPSGPSRLHADRQSRDLYAKSLRWRLRRRGDAMPELGYRRAANILVPLPGLPDHSLRLVSVPGTGEQREALPRSCAHGCLPLSAAASLWQESGDT